MTSPSCRPPIRLASWRRRRWARRAGAALAVAVAWIAARCDTRWWVAFACGTAAGLLLAGAHGALAGPAYALRPPDPPGGPAHFAFPPSP
jgi:hypothetical protein